MERVISVYALDGASQSVLLRESTRTAQVISALSRLANIPPDVSRYFALYLVVSSNQSTLLAGAASIATGASSSSSDSAASSSLFTVPLVYCLKPSDKPLKVLQHVENLLMRGPNSHNNNNNNSNNNNNEDVGDGGGSEDILSSRSNSVSVETQPTLNQRSFNVANASLKDEANFQFFFADSRSEHWFQESNIRFDMGDPEFFSLLEKFGAGDKRGDLLRWVHRKGNETGIKSSSSSSTFRDGIWESRWFVLRGEMLCYDSASSLSWIPLQHSSVRAIPESVCGLKHCFDLNTNRRVFHLRAKDDEDMKSWIKVLETKIGIATENDYLRLAEYMISDQEYAMSRKAF